MYDLGQQFKMDYLSAKANPKSIVQGKNYRFTILTDRLIRLEYNENGTFEDNPTELVFYRNFETPQFNIRQDNKFLELTTKCFKLTYEKEKKFLGTKINQTAHLKIDLLNTEKFWYYKHPEIRNYKSPGFSLDDNHKQYDKGLYSQDGFVSIDDSNSMLFDKNGVLSERNNKEIDIYVFMYLNDFQGCLNDYFLITGRPALIPRFALGNWWNRDMAYKDTELKNLLDTFEKKEVPLSILLLNHDWHTRSLDEKKKNESGFTWNKKYISHPSSMINYMHNIGIHLGLTINPFEGIYSYEDNFSKFSEILTPDKNKVIPFNVLDVKCLDVYFKLLINPLDNMGVDFYFIDFNNTKQRKQLQILDHYHFLDKNKDFKQRSLILSRNPGVAPHRYPVTYSGKTIVSWDTLKMLPYYQNMASNIGLNFLANDIGGFYKGTEDNELYTRFVQLGTFSPILKFGSTRGKYYKREPWKWGVKTYSIVKDYLTLRHRLIPYLYTESYKYQKNGTPIIKPLYYKFPEYYDDSLYRNEYYFGSELFVAPIVSKKEYIMNRVIHKFFIPDGTWYDFVTGKKFPGGKSYVSFFKDEDYPVFAKSGSILTFGDNDNINDTSVPKNLEIQIFPGRSNTYTLYEDDGTTDMYKKGFYLLTSIDYNYLPSNYTVIIRSIEGKSGIVPEKRNYKFKFRNTKQANDVILYYNDTKIEANSYVDGPDFVVEANNIPTIGQLTLNCKGKDIEIDAVRLINEDIESIISDLQIETEMKEKIDKVIFSNLPIKKKRIEVRKLKNKRLEPKFVKLFLKLLEYIDQV